MRRWLLVNGMPIISAKVCLPAGAVSANTAPNSVGPGMLPMPAGPLLRSTQFSRTSRMISPKPMVTMAR